MEMLDILLMLGAAYVSWRAGKFFGSTLAEAYQTDELPIVEEKERILIEKIDSEFFAFKNNRFVTQNSSLAECIADAMSGNPNVILVAENESVESEIKTLLERGKQAM